MHINTTTSMVIFISIFVLFISIILVSINNCTISKISKSHSLLYITVKFSLMFLVGFMFVNMIITLLRVYRLINFEIKEYKGGNHEH